LQNTPGLPDTAWLARTGWTQHFAGSDLNALALQTQHPGPQDENDIDHLLSVLVQECKSYFAQAVKIASTSSHALLRWARSTSSTVCSPAPFRFVQPLTFNRYIRYWTRLLCYLFHSSMPDASSQNLLLLNAEQQKTLSNLICETESYALGYCQSPAQLHTAIHHLCLSLIQQYLPRSNMESPLLHFLGCLGIDKRTGSFRTPSTYTSILAGFIYGCRIILIYESHLLVSFTKSNDILSQFKTLQINWLTATSEHPFGDILNLLGYGVKCCTEFREPIIHWFDGHDCLVYCGQQLEISLLSMMIQELINHAYSIGLKDFLWNSSDLSTLELSKVYDQLGNRTVGYSVLHDPRNSSILNPRHLINRFLDSTPSNSSLFVQKPCPKTGKKVRHVVQSVFEQILHASEIFLELLMVLTQLCCGQPPRGTELLSTLICNTATHQRHLFVFNGELAIITNYNKSQSVIGKGTLILRTLPNCLSKLWLCYLAYTKPILRFTEDTLYKQLQLSGRISSRTKSRFFHTRPIYSSTTPPEINNLLFHSRQKPWETQRTTDLLRYYAEDYLSFDNLSISVYRHIAISIYRKRIGHAILIGDMDKEEQSIPAAIRQARHSRATSRRFYATEITEFNLLDSQTMKLFQHTSQAWHQHFDLNHYIPSLVEFSSAMHLRLNPPIGCKVPLRLYPRGQISHLIQLASQPHIPQTHPRTFNYSLVHIMISPTPRFCPSEYLKYT